MVSHIQSHRVTRGVRAWLAEPISIESICTDVSGFQAPFAHCALQSLMRVQCSATCTDPVTCEFHWWGR